MEIQFQIDDNFSISGWNATIPVAMTEYSVAYTTNDMHFFLRNFFEYYGNDFNYTRDIASPYFGRAVTKDAFDFKKIEQIPQAFHKLKSYMAHLKTSDVEQNNLFDNAPFVVQDPLELSLNVAKDFTLEKTFRFKEFCRQSFEIVKNRRP